MPPRPGAVAAVALSLLAAAGLACAQSPAPQPSPVTIHSTTQEVALDVVVRDAKGKAIRNLKPADLEVLEDGVRRPVTSFRWVPGREAMAQEAPAAAVEPGAPAVKLASTAQALPAVNLVCIVFHNLDPDSRPWAMAAAEEFLKNEFRPGTWAATFSLGFDSRLEVLHNFTHNREELAKSLHDAPTGINADFLQAASAVLNATPTSVTISEVVSGSGSGPGSGVSTSMDINGGDLNTQAIAGAEVSTGRGAKIMRGQQADFRQEFGQIEGMREADQLIAMFEGLGTLPGRKTVLLLSPGLASTGDPDYVEKILKRARRANISVYAIDTNGLTQNSNVVGANAALSYQASLSRNPGRGGTARSKQESRQVEGVVDAVRSSDPQASLGGLAEGTGGFLIGNTNDFRKSFQRVMEDMDGHYEVLYRPSSEVLDGRLRSIKVKVARAEAIAVSRNGYYALPSLNGTWAPSEGDLMGLAVLNLKPAAKAFPLQMAALSFGPQKAALQRVLTFDVPGSALTASPEPGQRKQHVQLSLLALIKDASGEVIDRFSQDASYDIPQDRLTELRASSLFFEHPITLPAGHYTIEAAAVDRQSRRASTSVVQFDNAASEGVRLSSILLVRRLEPAEAPASAGAPLLYKGQRVVPDLAGTVGAGMRPYAYFVVYPDRAAEDKPTLTLEFLAGGQVVARRTVELPPVDPRGAVPVLVTAAVRPGECELRVTAHQGHHSVIDSVHYRVASH